jgi:cbb3-type cytochrome oxidase maturation protein
MGLIYFLLPASLLLGAIFLGLFIWVVKSGQYSDLESPGHRAILDENKDAGVKPPTVVSSHSIQNKSANT